MKITKIPLDIENLFRYINYMAELTKWQEGKRGKPKYEKSMDSNSLS